MDQSIILVVSAVVGIVVLFAQVKLFPIASSLKEIQSRLPSIDSTLSEILRELRKKEVIEK
jgi:hypothetical protein